MKIETIKDLKEVLRMGAYTGVGAYPIYFITSDGAALSFAAVKSEVKRVFSEIKSPDYHDQFRVVEAEINWEDSSLYCEHTNELIESAYYNDESENN